METAPTLTHSYWSSTGRYQSAYDRLVEMIPGAGSASHLGKALERLRVAANCYYDLFNNGLCNSASEFRGVFGFSPKKMYLNDNGRGIDFNNKEMNERLNSKLDGLILDACREQNVDTMTVNERLEEAHKIAELISANRRKNFSADVMPSQDLKVNEVVLRITHDGSHWITSDFTPEEVDKVIALLKPYGTKR